MRKYLCMLALWPSFAWGQNFEGPNLRQQVLSLHLAQEATQAFGVPIEVAGPWRFSSAEALEAFVVEKIGTLSASQITAEVNEAGGAVANPLNVLQEYYRQRRASAHILEGDKGRLCVVIPFDAEKGAGDWTRVVAGLADFPNAPLPGPVEAGDWRRAQDFILRHEMSHCGHILGRSKGQSQNRRDQGMFLEYVADYTATAWYVRDFPQDRPWLLRHMDRRILSGFHTGIFSHEVGEAVQMALQDVGYAPEVAQRPAYALELAQRRAEQYTATAAERLAYEQRLKSISQDVSLAFAAREGLEPALKVAEGLESKDPLLAKISRLWISAWMRLAKSLEQEQYARGIGMVPTWIQEASQQEQTSHAQILRQAQSLKTLRGRALQRAQQQLVEDMRATQPSLRDPSARAKWMDAILALEGKSLPAS